MLKAYNLIFYSLLTSLLALLTVGIAKGQQSTLDSLTTALANTQDPKERVDLLEDLSAEYYYAGDAYQSIRYDSLAYLAALEIKDSISMITSLGNRGGTLEDLGLFSEAHAQYELALSLSEQVATQAKLAWCLGNIARTSRYLGRYQEAVAYYQRAYNVAESENDAQRQVIASQNVGGLYYELREFERCIEYSQRSLETFHALGKEAVEERYRQTFDQVLSASRINIGISYLEMGVLDSAKVYLDEVVATLASDPSFPNYSLALTGLGQVALAQGATDRAIAFFDQALVLDVEHENTTNQTATLTYLGSAYVQEGNYQKARELLVQSNQLAKASGYSFLNHTIAANLAQAYAGLGNYTQAYRWLSQEKQANDSIFQAGSRFKIEELESKFQNEKQRIAIAEAEIQLLKQEGVIRDLNTQRLLLAVVLVTLIGLVVSVYRSYQAKRKANATLSVVNQELQTSQRELKASNDTKDKLMSIVAHDLKNPFGILQSVSHHLAEDFDTLQPTNQKEMAKTINRSLTRTVDLVDNLLLWSRSQSQKIAPHLETTSLLPVVQRVVDNNQFLLEEKGLKIEWEIDDSAQVKADVNMLEVVIRNLLTNAIKFSPEGESIKVRSETSGADITYHISDYGPGMTPAKVEQLFQTNGVVKHSQNPQNPQGTGLGLWISQDMVSAMGGQVFAESKPGEGSTFSVTLTSSE
ncbi:MAG: tetratricopeptide repeat protein [Bacteroidota bacterium]